MRIKIALFLLLGLCLNLKGQNRLNGIQSSSQWPPRYDIPTRPMEMPLPYLENKPNVININIGRQLFVDDFLIDATNLTRVSHKPTFYTGNPVLEPDKEWEKTSTGMPYAAPFSDGLWYDENDGKFKMWYLAGAGSIHKEDNQTFYTCYAESKDGKNWAKPILDVIPGTNIVDTCNRDAATIWLDRFEKDPSKRWKFFNVERRASDRRWQFVLKYSSDGIHWSKGVAQSGDIYDRSTAFYNPFTQKWVLSLRGSTPVSSRSRYYIENDDPETLVSLTHRINSNIHDKNIVYWFTPDQKELRHPLYPNVAPGIYNFDAIAYESIMLGYYSAWCGPENDVCAKDNIQKRNVISLGYSRDGFHFYRPTHEAFMNVNETEGAWNWGNVQSVCGVPIIKEDSLYFYASGRRLNNIFWDCYTSTGLATLRRDGFVSMHADKEGYLVTEKLSFDGDYFFVNIKATNKKGELDVELIDESGKVIPGYSRKECNTLRGLDSTKKMVTWKNKNDIVSLKGKNIKVKFYLKQLDLYAFWISQWKTGESKGFTAGGGPNLSSSGIDIPSM